MNRTTPPRTERRFRLSDLAFDEERWRRLLELADDDHRDAQQYANVQLERLIDRQWSQRTRKQTQVA